MLATSTIEDLILWGYTAVCVLTVVAIYYLVIDAFWSGRGDK